MRIGTIVISGLMALSLSACSEDEPLLVESAVRPEFSFQVEDTMAKAVVESFQSGDQLGLCLMDASGNPYDGEADCFNAAYTLQSGGKWDPSRDIRLSSAQGKVYAYYPYDATLAADGLLTVTNGEELLLTRSAGTVSSSSPKAVIRLSHVMALLKFNISSDKGTVSRVRVRNLPLSASWCLWSGALSLDSETTIMDIEDLGLLSTGIPVIPGKALEVMVYTDQGCFISKPGEVLQSGKIYTITLN